MRTEASVEAGDVGVGLLEPCMFLAREREICNDMQAVSAAAAQPGTTQTTILGMKRISRCTSRMCSRPLRDESIDDAVSPSAYL